MQIATGTFKRMSPGKFADRIGIPIGWIVIRHSHLPKKLARRQTHGRWVRVTCQKRAIFRVLRYSVNLKTDDIVMDWAGWIDLQGRTDQESATLALTICTARWFDYFSKPFRHVDPAYRLSAWLGAISIGLGLLSVLISFR